LIYSFCLAGFYFFTKGREENKDKTYYLSGYSFNSVNVLFDVSMIDPETSSG